MDDKKNLTTRDATILIAICTVCFGLVAVLVWTDDDTTSTRTAAEVATKVIVLSVIDMISLVFHNRHFPSSQTLWQQLRPVRMLSIRLHALFLGLGRRVDIFIVD